MGKIKGKQTAKDKTRLSAKMLGLLIFIVFAAFFIGQIFLPKEMSIKSEDDIAYKGDFIRILPDGTTEPVQGKSADIIKYELSKGEPLIVETVLPDNVSDADSLFYNSTHQSVYMYLKDPESYGNAEDGELLASYDTTDSTWFGTNSASRYIQLDLNREMSGKVLRIKIISDSSFSGRFDTVYYGRADEIWNFILRLRIPCVIMASALLLIGSLTIIGCYILGCFIKKNISLAHIGWCGLVVGMWIMCESRFRVFFFNSASWTAIMAFFFLIAYPGTILVYINDIQGYRFDKLHKTSLNVLFLFFIAVAVLHFTRIYDVMHFNSIIYLMDYLVLITVWVSLIIDIRNKNIDRYKYAAIGFVLLSVFNLVEIIADTVFKSIYTGMFTGIGTMAFIIMAIIDTVIAQIGLEKEKNRAVAEGQAKSMFLANMSHEIRTPINAVLGMNEMILRDTKEDAVREYASNIESSGNLLLSIINDILDFSKIESGKMDIVPVDYELSSVVNDLVNALRPKAEAKDLGFVVEIDETLPEYLHGDDNRLRQIIINLVNNAIKYTEQGQVTFRLGGEKTADSVILRADVIDTGKGIKKEDLGKLFESFRRVDEESNRNIEGTGLGLSIAGSLANLMGGTITVESEYHKGSTFTVTVPQKITKPGEIGSYSKRSKESQKKNRNHSTKFTASNAKVLVVDDNSMNLKVFKLLLRETKIQVTMAGGGMEAIELLSDNKFDIIFLDHLMPEMDGIETLKKIKEIYPEMKSPVIALTANAISGAKEMYLENGFDGYLSKPIVAADLEETILEKLDKSLIDGLSLI